jgi:hypothetical protein
VVEHPTLTQIQLGTRRKPTNKQILTGTLIAHRRPTRQMNF